MPDPYSIAISSVSLIVSVTTLWVTLLRRGQVAMTAPTIVFFGFDSAPHITPKVFLRTLLYSTSARGQVIEAMYVKLARRDSEELFSFWGYGETSKLVPGSGLFVGQTGFAANHHFLLTSGREYEFAAGEYTLWVFARVVGRAKSVGLTQIKLKLTDEQIMALKRREGVLFERLPNAEGYVGRIDGRRTT